MVTCLLSPFRRRRQSVLLHQPIIPIGAHGFTLRARLKSTDFVLGLLYERGNCPQ